MDLARGYPLGCCRISRHIRRLAADEAGQSTVEAALLLPTLSLLLAMLVQPVCLGYTRMVMCNAAAETARVIATSNNTAAARSFALRRLRAVPEMTGFHTGGEGDWQIRLARSSEGVSVRIVGHVPTLPLFGAVAALACERDERGIVLSVEVSERVRPRWLEGDYTSWMQEWKK